MPSMNDDDAWSQEYLKLSVFVVAAVVIALSPGESNF